MNSSQNTLHIRDDPWVFFLRLKKGVFARAMSAATPTPVLEWHTMSEGVHSIVSLVFSVVSSRLKCHDCDSPRLSLTSDMILPLFQASWPAGCQRCPHTHPSWMESQVHTPVSDFESCRCFVSRRPWEGSGKIHQWLSGLQPGSPAHCPRQTAARGCPVYGRRCGVRV